MLELVPYFGILAQNLEFDVKYLNFSPSVCCLAVNMSKSCLCKGQGRKGGGLGSSGRFRHGCRHGCWIKRFPPHFVWVCVCLCVCIYPYMHKYIFIYVCMLVCVCVHVCLCLCLSIYLQMYLHMYASLQIYIHIPM